MSIINSCKGCIFGIFNPNENQWFCCAKECISPTHIDFDEKLITSTEDDKKAVRTV